MPTIGRRRADVSLKGRRLNARGISAYSLPILKRRLTIGIGNRATLTTSLAGANNDLTLFARSPGTAGNSLTFRIVVSGNNTALSLSYAAPAITVNSATDGGGVATSTANQIVDLINRDNSYNTATPSGAGDAVHAQLAPANDGTGAVVAVGATALSGAV